MLVQIPRVEKEVRVWEEKNRYQELEHAKGQKPDNESKSK